METFENTELLEPLLLYKNRLKDAFHSNSEEYFDELTKKGEVNVELNQDYCKKYYKELEIINQLNKKKGGKNFLRVLSWIGLFGFIALAIVMIMMAVKKSISMGLGIGLGVGGIVLAALCIVAIIKLTKSVKNLKQIIAQHEEVSKKHLDAAYQTMEKLNSLYEWNMGADIFTKTTPLIQMDQVFSPEKLQYLKEKYGYSEYSGGDISSVYVQSGSILGNPFVFEKNYCQVMGQHQYSGTLVITYQVLVRDSNGRSHYETRTQTLVAYYTAPEPQYYLDTWLIYGNEAAPRLKFSRYPTDINTMSENQIKRYVKNFDAKLDKMVAKDLKKNPGESTFTRLANEEFEALFNALDSNNETEFRLLFTPLGQKNMINLLKGKDIGFGDDFIFKKREKLNYIKTSHMQGSDSLDRNPDSFVHFDYKVARENFINYADKYLKDVYFDLAPVISIPLYQQHKSIDYIYEKGFNRKTTNAEVESAANSFGTKIFQHPATRSAGVILKSFFNKKVDDNSDLCTIRAYSFEGIDRVAYVPTMGGDGKMHNVPVHWIEYLPVQKDTPFIVSDTNSNRQEYQHDYSSGKFDSIINKFGNSSAILYKKRLMSFIPKK